MRSSTTSNITGKEPWIAVNLSMLFPEIGQIYGGSAVKGWFLIIIQLFAFGLGGWILIAPYKNFLITLISYLVIPSIALLY